ncbi:MAG TPA: Uma2 family endonuclease [Polyangia bacterium]|jgi:Uma2 family endonuclease|nr:Uma2 family endonuclease [Polyangia bacterium]
MGVPARLHHYSFKDYLTVEEMNPVRHEFLEGEIYAMAGGSILHAALTVAVSSALHKQLAGRCRVFSSDLRVRSLATGLACYPDVTVVCGNVETDPESKETVANPTVVVEVLSPATIDYDLSEKFDHYRRIPSLKAVVYVWQDRRQIEIRARGALDDWRVEIAGSGAIARLEPLGCALDVDALYTDAGA